MSGIDELRWKVCPKCKGAGHCGYCEERGVVADGRHPSPNAKWHSEEHLRESVAQRTIDRLRIFTETLESGCPIECTRVERHMTPDGPMHVRKYGVIES